MARKLRLEYAGVIYHVMNRGDRREPISGDNADRNEALCGGAGGVLLEDRLAGSPPRVDAQSFSSGCDDTAAQP